MNPRTAFVAGASGLIGSFLARLLCERPEYDVVRIGIRRKIQIQSPKLRQEIIDFDRLEESLDFKGVTDVFCTLGTTIRKAGTQQAFRRVDFEYPHSLAQIAARDHVQGFLIVTSLGANAMSGNFYLRTKGEVEDAIKKTFEGSLHFFRPSLLLGERGKVRMGERIGSVVLKFASFSMIGRFRKYRPILASKVAGGMVCAALGSDPGVHIHESDRIRDLAEGARHHADHWN